MTKIVISYSISYGRLLDMCQFDRKIMRFGLNVAVRIYYNMVSWDAIKLAIKKNTHAISVQAIKIPSSQIVDKFPIQLQIAIPVVSKPDVQTTVTKGREIDPVSIDLADTIELYESSSYSSKKVYECEEAQRMESMLSALYTSENGRSRGWTKVGLESLIRPRCASGGDIRELDKSKMAFTWQLIGTDKLASAFLDFVCIAKKIRIAVWFEEEKHVILFPAADQKSVPHTSLPIYHISSKGIIRKKIDSKLTEYCDSNKWILMPPNSVFQSLSGLTLSELESLGQKIGIVDISGSKKEKIAKIANWKLRQRLDV